MRTRPGSMFCVLTAALALAGCGETETVTVTEATTVTTSASTAETGATTPGPEAVGDIGPPTDALKRLLTSQTRDSADYREPVKSGELVSPHFVEAVEQGSRELGYLDFNPFLCAQQIPTSIDYVDEAVDGDRARVTATITYGPASEETQVYDMVIDAGAWKLDRSECMG